MESACSISQAQHVTSARESFSSTVSDKVRPSDHSHLHGASHTTIQAGCVPTHVPRLSPFTTAGDFCQ